MDSLKKIFVGLKEFQLKILSTLLKRHFPPMSVSDTHEIVGSNLATYGKDPRKAHDLLLNMPDFGTKKIF